MGGKNSKKKKNEDIEDLKNMYVKYDVDKPQITINNKKYEIVEKIGQGGFGVVYKAIYNKQAFAIKQMKINSDNADSILKELTFVAQVSNGTDPRYLPIIRYFGIEHIDSSIFMVMELALCDLNDFVERKKLKKEMTKNFVDVIFAFVLRALLFLYENDTIHGDIKFANFVLLEDDAHPLEFNIKLIDFGTINKLDSNVSKIQNDSIAGTLLYLAPEQANATVHKKTDIWALGIMLYELVFSGYPEYAKDQKSIISFLASPNDLKIPNPTPELQNYKQVIEMCLVKDTSKRASARDLLAILPRVMDAKIIELVIGVNVQAFKSKAVTAHMQMRRNPPQERPETSRASNTETKYCRVCSTSLPSSHQYNRCDSCFKNRNKKCIHCGKVMINFRFSRCNDCFQKTKHLDQRK